MRVLKCSLAIIVLAVLALPAHANVKIRVNKPEAVVRSVPEVSGQVVRVVAAGMILEAIEKSNDWYKVQLPAADINPAQQGFIRREEVSELIEVVPATPEPRPQPEKMDDPLEAVQPELGTTPTAAIAVKPLPAKLKKFKRFVLHAAYLTGSTVETLTSTFSRTIYREQANFATSYEARKGNSIDAALGFMFFPAFGAEVGAANVSRDVTVKMTAAVPHPLFFDRPRQAAGNEGYELKETDLYLNLIYTLKMKILAIDLFAGPCYVMSETTIVTGYTVADSYPYTQVNVTYDSQKVKKNTVGLNAGIAAGYYFHDTVGLVVSARFISAKAEFDTATDVPGITYKLGGLQAGVGLKIKF